MDDNTFVFTEIVRCGLIGRVAFQTFHHFHNRKLHIYGRKSDFEMIQDHPNNVYHYLDDSPEIVNSFNSGHRGTSMVWTKVILERPEQHIVHIDSDVVFRGDAVEEVVRKLKEGYDIVGSIRNYPNNPHKNRDDVRHLPDVTSTYCFGFSKDRIFVKEPHLLARLVENSLDVPTVHELMRRYPNRYFYHPTIDYFDPVAFIIIDEGGKVFILDKDVMGGFNEQGEKVNKYGFLNKDCDFGDKIVHFASVGSGLNFLQMKGRGETIDVPEWYVDYGLSKLDLYMRLFYKTAILPDEKSQFLAMKPHFEEAFRELKIENGLVGGLRM